MFKYEYVEEEPKRDYVHLLPGKCRFEVLKCMSTKKTGEGYYATVHGKRHSALMVKYLVTDREGRKEYVYDLIFHWKLKSLLNAANRLNLYSKGGSLNEDLLIGLKGDCEIEHQENPPYPKKNAIKKYLWPEDSLTHDQHQLEKQKQEQQADDFDAELGDIPF